jgi:hypothetical protein
MVTPEIIQDNTQEKVMDIIGGGQQKCQDIPAIY